MSGNVTAAQTHANAARDHVDKIVEKTVAGSTTTTPELHELALNARGELDGLTRQLLAAQKEIGVANETIDVLEKKADGFLARFATLQDKVRKYARLRMILALVAGLGAAWWFFKGSAFVVSWVPSLAPYVGVAQIVLPLVTGLGIYFGVDLLL